MGIDIGFVATGWVIVRVGDYSCVIDSGTILTEPATKKTSVRVADSDAERAGIIYRELYNAITLHGPHGIAMELPSGGAQGARANRAMGIATGVGGALIAATGLPCEYVTPQAVKMAMTGQRNASKEQMMHRARQLHPDCNWPKAKKHFEHQADALGAVEAIRYGLMWSTLKQMEANR